MEDYTLTLGELIDKLKTQNQDNYIKFSDGLIPCKLNSWRGSYSQLALSTTNKPKQVSKILKRCLGAVRETYCGYKGGEFVMNLNTNVWRDNYGESTCTAILDVTEVDGFTVIEVGHREY